MDLLPFVRCCRFIRFGRISSTKRRCWRFNGCKPMPMRHNAKPFNDESLISFIFPPEMFFSLLHLSAILKCENLDQVAPRSVLPLWELFPLVVFPVLEIVRVFSFSIIIHLSGFYSQSGFNHHKTSVGKRSQWHSPPKVNGKSFTPFTSLAPKRPNERSDFPLRYFIPNSVIKSYCVKRMHIAITMRAAREPYVLVVPALWSLLPN